jgi:hypothetical protein
MRHYSIIIGILISKFRDNTVNKRTMIDTYEKCFEIFGITDFSLLSIKYRTGCRSKMVCLLHWNIKILQQFFVRIEQLLLPHGFVHEEEVLHSCARVSKSIPLQHAYGLDIHRLDQGVELFIACFFCDFA